MPPRLCPPPLMWAPTFSCGQHCRPAPLLTWIVPPCILLSNCPTGPVASPRCVAAAHGSYHFGDMRFTTLRRSSLLIFWDPQLTSDHLTQARATLRPVRPSGRSPKQRCNLCIHLFSLRVPHESTHKVSCMVAYN